MKHLRWVTLVALLAMVLAACGGGETTETTVGAAPDTTTAPTETMAPDTTAAPETTQTTMAEPSVGTADDPIQVLFVPSVSADEIVAGGELLSDALGAATGLEFEVQVPASYAATVEEICANPGASIGFIPAQAYILGNELCGMEAALKAERFGYTEYWAQYLVARDSDFQTLEDLNGASWAYPDPGSTSGFLFPSGELQALGVEWGEELEAGSHDGAVRAVYNGETDFGTSFYSPYTDLEGNGAWDGDPANADVPDPDSCAINADGEIQCGEFIVQDARRNLREELPDVVQQVRILTVSDPIPNDGVVFGPDFPDEVQEQIVTALTEFAANDPEGFATAFEAYSWDNLAGTSDADYDSVREIVQTLGITIDDL
ncbi:MAG TPA: phosphate/phosphite/phosphonate ABC transporter substrate-binding protein [Acidimicrobiia bacterium]|nr:phosphate/phosphite/phosphonate ABC transporter substrate-binding protein [Acidimicrobiia bacterium]